MATQIATCPENEIVESDVLGDPVYQGKRYRGPHHWVRVGTWTETRLHIEPPLVTYRQLASGLYQSVVARPLYECVYCLEERRYARTSG